MSKKKEVQVPPTRGALMLDLLKEALLSASETVLTVFLAIIIAWLVRT